MVPADAGHQGVLITWDRQVLACVPAHQWVTRVLGHLLLKTWHLIPRAQFTGNHP